MKSFELWSAGFTPCFRLVKTPKLLANYSVFDWKCAGVKLKVFSQEKGDWVTPDDGELSRGTIDQLFLAARLALLDLLYQDAKPPLLLDDPFVKFDSERREQALRLCQEIAQEHQVFLFTCSDEYDKFADHVIALSSTNT